MYGLSIGVSNMSDTLPRAAYALLSGLNAATVGVIVLAAVELSQKAITDPMTRLLVFLVGAAGLLYNALWYFPVLMLAAGLIALVHDFRWLHGPVNKVVGVFKKKRDPGQPQRTEEGIEQDAVRGADDGRVSPPLSSNDLQRETSTDQSPPTPPPEEAEEEDRQRIIPAERRLTMSWKLGLGLIVGFLATFTVVMVTRGVLSSKPLLFRLFANMYLAGTIIFGGGPVVIPLLREYVVAEGWVSPRDFLIGLALIQAFPGPNFNFAVYLGSLTASNAGQNSVVGALIGFFGIFIPGLWLVHGTIGVWAAIRGVRGVKSVLRGVNAGAVGLVYTAVYRLWQMGYIDEGYRNGTSLAVEPWWVVVTATSFVGGMWFGLKPFMAIILGAIMGLIWYGVVTS